MKNIPVLLSIIALLSSFCKKEGQLSNVAQDLTNGAWIQAQSLSDSDGDGVFVDVSLSCEYDNTWVFHTDSTMTINDIGVLCAPDIGPITISGYWVLSNNNQVLSVVLSQGFTQDEYNIVSISDSLLVLHFIDPSNPAGPPKQKLVLER